MRVRWKLLLSAALVLNGCGRDAEDALVACDPLASAEAPIELGHVLAVGQAPDGTLYVMDEDPKAPGQQRVFVSDGHALQRRDVNGSGEDGSMPGVRRIALLVPGETPFTLFAELQGDKASRMLVVLGELRAKQLDISAQIGGQVLEVVDEAALAGLRVQNLEGSVVVEYSTRIGIEDEGRLVVTRPAHDWSYEDFRVFFGRAGKLEEQQVTSVTRALDGGSTWVRFIVDTEPAEAFFASQLRIDPDDTVEPDTFELGGLPLDIERLPQDEPEVDRLSFFCLH